MPRKKAYEYWGRTTGTYARALGAYSAGVFVDLYGGEELRALPKAAFIKLSGRRRLVHRQWRYFKIVEDAHAS